MFTHIVRTMLAGLAALSCFILYFERQGRILSDWASNTVRGAHSDGCPQAIVSRELDRPHLSSFLDIDYANAKISANVEEFLDFAIIGHPKTATTYMMEWLAMQPEVQMYTEEIHFLQMGRPAEFVKHMYELPAGKQFKRGYKAPRDIVNVQVLDFFAHHWPRAQLIVGLRHPVLWLESFYNFRIRHNISLPPADSPLLIGRCREGTHGVCTDEAQFHYHLALLGKVNMTAAHKLDFFHQDYIRRRIENRPRKFVPNKVFLYEINQLHDDNEERYRKFRHDLADHVGLTNEIKPWIRTKDSAPKSKVLDICEDAYIPLRNELMKHAKSASLWIRKYFLGHPDVRVSSEAYFRDLLLEWMVDPCVERKSVGKE